jgi:hypothetical protein
MQLRLSWVTFRVVTRASWCNGYAVTGLTRKLLQHRTDTGLDIIYSHLYIVILA